MIVNWLMNLNWGTVVVSVLGALVTSVWITPWTERRKVVAAATRQYNLRPSICECCAGRLPSWFLGVEDATDDDGRVTRVLVCRGCVGETPGSPRPYEEKADFTWRTRRQGLQRFFRASLSLVALSRVRAGR
jgi:hypothetical protein